MGWSRQVGLVGAVICLAIIPQPSLQQPAAAPAAIENSTKLYQVCTLDRPPMSFCNDTIKSTEYTGLSLEIFRQAASDLQWKEGVNYEFKCLVATTTAVMADLIAANGTCDLAIASITITSERQDLGVKFAYPYYKSAVGIMVRTQMAPASGWSWVEPFSVNLWIAIAVTMLAWPLAVYLIESCSIKPTIRPKDVCYGVEEATWQSLWSLQHGHQFEVHSLGARIAVLCFSFVALIIGSSYTANLAAVLTISRVNSIRSIYDLGGLAVASVPVYIPRLRSQYGIIASDANITGIASVGETAELVARGSLAAFLYDQVVAQYVTATFPGCSVRMLPDAVQPFDYGLAFRSDTPDSFVAAFSASILRVQEAGSVSQYEDRFLMTKSPCLSAAASAVGGSIDRISFQSVYGLWVILVAGLVVGAAVAVAVRQRRKKVWAAQRAKLGELPRAGGAEGEGQRVVCLDRAHSTLVDVSRNERG